jgi:hypothetical protein
VHVHAEASAEWSAWLSAVLGEPWVVTFGRARSTPVQARHRAAGRCADLRLHEMFRAAPAEVREALGRWLRVGRRAKRASALLDRWIHDQLACLPPSSRTMELAPEGRVHDLAALSVELCSGEFAADFNADAPAPAVTWGRRAPSRSRRSLRLGSFEPGRHVVRMHPVLDQAGVPQWFVRFVLKHELLHAVFPPCRDGAGRWIHHGPEFQRRERAWPDYAPAVAWEHQNLPRLIRSAREGSALRVRVEDPVIPSR